VPIIDVSSNQNHPLNYSAISNYLKSDGFPGVVIKLSQGSDYANPFALQDLIGFSNQQVPCALYHFVDNSPVQSQLQWITKQYDLVVSSVPNNYFPVWIDFEGSADPATIAQFLSPYPRLYTNPSDLNTVPTLNPAVLLWIADPTNQYNPSRTDVTLLARQTTVSSIPGYDGSIDVSYVVSDSAYKQFFNFTSITPAPAPLPPVPPAQIPTLQGEPLNIQSITWPSDASGKGFVVLGIPWANFLSVYLNGPYPATDGYWPSMSTIFSAQERNGNTCISWENAVPNTDLTFNVRYI
jgi:hypothetical protein